MYLTFCNDWKSQMAESHWTWAVQKHISFRINSEINNKHTQLNCLTARRASERTLRTPNTTIIQDKYLKKRQKKKKTEHNMSL